MVTIDDLNEWGATDSFIREYDGQEQLLNLLNKKGKVYPAVKLTIDDGHYYRNNRFLKFLADHNLYCIEDGWDFDKIIVADLEEMIKRYEKTTNEIRTRFINYLEFFKEVAEVRYETSKEKPAYNPECISFTIRRHGQFKGQYFVESEKFIFNLYILQKDNTIKEFEFRTSNLEEYETLKKILTQRD